jgi:capsular polysaccharide biosynthesis protein
VNNGSNSGRATDADETMILSLQSGELPLRRPWGSVDFAGEEFVTPEERFAGDLAAGVASLGFIRGEIARRAQLWIILAIIGLLAGIGVYIARPAPYQASTWLLIANPPGSAPGIAVQNDQAIVESRTVASAALHTLGINENPVTFVSQYSSTVVTDEVLAITVKNRSATLAINEANALAKAFLAYQSHLLLTQEQLVNASLQQQVSQAEQNVNSLSSQISQLSSQPSSQSQQARLSALRSERSRAETSLATLRQTVTSSEASTQVATTTALKGSQVLDPAVASPPSKKKRLALYGGGGLLGGLVIGLGIVVIGAVASERLRRRDDISRALGAPVRLSVGPVKVRRKGDAAISPTQAPEVRRVVAHLASALPAASHGLMSLAVVPVDDFHVPAICMAYLALSCVQEAGARVIVADLYDGAPVARLLNARESGVHNTTVDGWHLVVFVPETGDAPPLGPLRPGSSLGKPSGALSAACQEADLLLTFAPLDAATGSDHLATWAQCAVATVTAGRSSSTRINAVGELIRMAGVPLASAVLLGGDAADESLGAFGAVGGATNGMVTTAGVMTFVGADGLPGMASPEN